MPPRTLFLWCMSKFGDEFTEKCFQPVLNPWVTLDLYWPGVLSMPVENVELAILSRHLWLGLATTSEVQVTMCLFLCWTVIHFTWLSVLFERLFSHELVFISTWAVRVCLESTSLVHCAFLDTADNWKVRACFLQWLDCVVLLSIVNCSGVVDCYPSAHLACGTCQKCCTIIITWSSENFLGGTSQLSDSSAFTQENEHFYFKVVRPILLPGLLVDWFAFCSLQFIFGPLLQALLSTDLYSRSECLEVYWLALKTLLPVCSVVIIILAPTEEEWSYIACPCLVSVFIWRQSCAASNYACAFSSASGNQGAL